MPVLIDTHAHLDEGIYGNDPDAIIGRALADGVWTVTIGSDYDSSRKAIAIAERHPVGVYAAVGVHPCRVSGEPDDIILGLEKFGELAKHPKVVAIGETGLDYRNSPESADGEGGAVSQRIRDGQKQVFGRFLQLSSEFRLPLLLHCREAHSDMLDILERWDRTSRVAGIGGIVHHFSGNWKDAKRYFDLDFMISTTGLLAYGAHQAEVFRKAPLDRIVLESDCPHLTAVPWSQRRCEPTYLANVAVALAGLRQEPLGRIVKATTDNALRVLGKLG
ncbi:TatD family hydrolase [Candidatus Uhrbacteria bacterium]|nr:TatD family hydrolase [Candidatus Uhrbacteria bacterium]